MKKNSIVFVAGLTFLLISCTSNGQELPAIKKEIEKDNALYFGLFDKTDTAIINLYTGDGCLLAPNAPAICGKSALTRDFKDTYAAGQIKGVKFSTIDVYGDGALYVTEEGTWQVLDSNDRVLDTGKYLKLWKKTKQGWRIFRDVFNSDHKNP
jgi:ketosteroid isomerase-like protein